MKVVITGCGIAGNEVAFSLRDMGSNAEITILSAEKFPEYDPCALPYFLGGEVPRDVVFRKRTDDYKNRGINLVLETKVVSIDPSAKKVISEDGREFPYDKLVLAHGGSLFVPPIKGVEKKGVLSCKKLSDVDMLVNRNGCSAVVIGSGAIGIEAGEALKRRGYKVHIIELLDWILPVLFDRPVAKRLEKALEGYGIKVFTGEKVMEIKGGQNVTSVVTDKREIPCDTVVLATGVVPGKDLARTAGIEVGRGIKVNTLMETSVKDIYACGDCVETIDACTGESCMYQLKHNAVEQARIVAMNIMGENVFYNGAYAFARAHFFNTHAASFGKTARSLEKEKDVEIIERESKGNFLMVVVKSGKIAGAQAIGRFADHLGLFMGAMWRKDDINLIRKKWPKIMQKGSSYPWTYRKIGFLIGLGSL